MSPRRLLFAKVIIGLVLGTLLGFAVGSSLAKDAAKGRELTIEQYVAEFQQHKADLETSAVPLAGAVAVGILMVAGALALYEALAYGLALGIGVLARTTFGTPSTEAGAG